jgi:hypothetical protein
MIEINYWAILITTVVSVILGTIWFGPLFGKVWMKMVGISKPEGPISPEIKKMMTRSYILVIIGSVLMNLTLIYSIVFGASYLQIEGVRAGIQAAFWNWLGFIAPVTLGPVLWENRPWKYWFITAGYYLVLLLINGAILAIWR